jgi:hypothetical protein
MNEEIGTVVPRGNHLYVYNKQGQQLCTIGGESSQPNQGLIGFTSSSVSVKRNNLIYIYNAKGQQISTVGA